MYSSRYQADIEALKQQTEQAKQEARQAAIEAQSKTAEAIDKKQKAQSSQTTEAMKEAEIAEQQAKEAQSNASESDEKYQELQQRVDDVDAYLETETVQRGKSDIQEVLAEETNRGIDLDEARSTENATADVYDKQPYKTEQHHWLPQQHRDKFEALGINIDDFTTDLDQRNHQTVIHPRVEGVMAANEDWNQYFPENPDITPKKCEQLTPEKREQLREQTMTFGKELQAKLGYENAEMHLYKDYTKSTNFDESKKSSGLTSSEKLQEMNQYCDVQTQTNTETQTQSQMKTSSESHQG